MAIANAEHEGGDAVAGAGASERVDHMFIPSGIQIAIIESKEKLNTIIIHYQPI